MRTPFFRKRPFIIFDLYYGGFMKNFTKILVALSLAATFSFAQDDEYEDDESPWGSTEETQEEEAEEQAQEATSPASVSAPAEEKEDVVAKVLARKKAKDAERKQQEEERGMSAIDQMEEENAAREARSGNRITDNFGFGIHGAFDYSNLYGLAQDWDLGEDEDAPAGIGFEVGIAFRIPMLPIIQFTPEIAYRMSKLKQEDEAYNRNFRQQDLIMPLYVRVMPLDWLYLGAGVQLGLNLTNKASIDGEVDLGGGLGKTQHSITENINQSSFNFGLLFAVGGYIVKGLSVDFRLYMGLNDMYPDFKSDDEDNTEYSKLINLYGAKLMSYKFGIGYWFM